VKFRTSIGKHKIRNFMVLGIVLVVILAFAVPFIYIHFIEGPAPAKLSLPPRARPRRQSDRQQLR
jgi:hypothetical protein